MDTYYRVKNETVIDEYLNLMKILMITYRFPPYNSSGAIRCGKMAKYLIELGHEVHVISCKDQPLQKSLPLEIPEKYVTYTDWWNINAPVEKLLGGREKVVREGLYSAIKKPGLKSKILKVLGKLYKDMLHMPDAQVGWQRAATKKGIEIAEKWQPDVIYASAHPISSFVVANNISRKTGVWWIGELRDLWTDSPYSTCPVWRKPIENYWERKLFSKASALTTITDHSAELLAKKYDCPIEVILNGFDTKDFEMNDFSPNIDEGFIDDGVNILYAGMIYPGRRDPASLLIALSQLPDRLKSKVKLHFYGTQMSSVIEKVQALGIMEHVSINDSIAYKDILALQQKADVLLLLMWNDPQEKGTFTGKFFEYIGARRPILCIGGTNSPPAKLIIERDLGVVLYEPEEIKVYLEEIIQIKDEKGSLQKTSANAGKGLTRKDQAEKLSSFLSKVISDGK